MRDAARNSLSRYLDQHLIVFGEVPDAEAFRRDYKRLEGIGEEIWSAVAAECRQERSKLFADAVLTPLTQVFDVATARRATLGNHPPMVIYVLLHALALVCAFLAGFASGPAKRPSWVHLHVLAAAIAATIYVTLDLEFPRHGMIRVDAADALLRELRATMK